MKNLNEQSLLNRVNRKLNIEQPGIRVRRCQYVSRWFNNLGHFYMVNSSNAIVAQHIDLDELAQEFGVLH